MVLVVALTGTLAIAEQPRRGPVQVFILAGQSNMEGQAVADLEGKDYNFGKGTLKSLLRDPAKAPRLRHLQDQRGQWAVRRDVWVRYQPEHGTLKAGPLTLGFTPYPGQHHFGPELQFGHVVGDYLGKQVLLIKTCWGGKSLFKDFRPPSSDGTVGPYYTRMLREVRQALANLKSEFPDYDGQGYELAGFVWYQGWNDGVDPQRAVPEYEQNLVNLIKDVRKDLRAPQLPVVVGELTGPWLKAPDAWDRLRRAQAAAAARPEFRGSVLFVETHNFVRKAEESPNPGHGHHEFGNAETYFLVGDALGQGMVKLLKAGKTDLHAPQPPYDVFPPAEPPYYRVCYAASAKPGELIFGVNYTLWIPKNVKTLRGIIVHQHGCGEGSCRSGLTGAYDLHWQALAQKHDCALLAPAYEQPEKADCQMWCDPRNGSAAAFQKCLVDLGAKSGHPELARVPWALWGHSGGGHWAGGMVLLHPDHIAAAWLRSGVPLLKADPKRAGIKAHTLPDAALKVPIMCNLGTKEGVTVKGERFAGVWPANEVFFNEIRGRGGLICVAVDPLSSHECGNQRYLAIPWLDACLSARLPKAAGDRLQPMPTDKVWLGPLLSGQATPAAKFTGDPRKAGWLPNEAMAKSWMEYVKDTKVTDTTPPPAPTNVRLQGNKLTWEAEADLESGLAHFLIERDGRFVARVPEKARNPFGRPIFQGLQYSDTPPQPLVPMQFTDTTAEAGKTHTYRVIAVNTVGLKSQPSADAASR
jgi:hypothetical protein